MCLSHTETGNMDWTVTEWNRHSSVFCVKSKRRQVRFFFFFFFFHLNISLAADGFNCISFVKPQCSLERFASRQPVLKRGSLCETVSRKTNQKKPAPQIVARLVLMQEHLVCLICLLIFQLKNRLQLSAATVALAGKSRSICSRYLRPQWVAFYQAEIHSQFISQKCRNKMKTIREHGRNIKDTK